MNRRSFLRLAGLSAAGAALSPSFARAASRNALSQLVGGPVADRFPQIQHIVVLVMENHSFDNVLGTLKRPHVDGLRFRRGVAVDSNPDASGKPVSAFHLPTMCQDGYHVSQSWNASHRQWNHGAMDGFVVTSGTEAMGYYTEDDLPVTHALAKIFPVCDRWFCSTLCQTFPNRMFMFAGTAQGATSTDVQERAQASPPKAGTMFDRLTQAGISWKNYMGDLGDSMLWGPTYFAKNAAHVTSVAEFYIDAAAGLLPAVSIISPEAEEISEENPQNMAIGEAFVWSIANAVLTSPLWSSSMLVVTYDEHGGHYDHVPPFAVPNPDGTHPNVPNYAPDDYTLSGFRVPSIVISPWAKRDYVSHVPREHTAILRFMEKKWNLPPLTRRDAAADDLLDIFDFKKPSFLKAPSLPMPDVLAPTVKCIQAGQRPIAVPGA